MIIVLFLFFFMGRSITTFTFKKFVINKAFVSLLPKEYTLEEAEAVRKEVYDFYDRAGSEEVSDLDLLRVSGEIQNIMRDDRITPEEVAELRKMIREIKNQGSGVGGRVSEKEAKP
ncbi:MAG TPA: hypothetical protein VFG95_07955 [Nitrospiria bacterium]|nr:hypothetical protein [Nitrospiria bacterium]